MTAKTVHATRNEDGTYRVVINKKCNGKEYYVGRNKIVEEGEITLVSDDPVYVMSTTESGYNPLEYLRYYCKECGTYCIADDYDVEKDMCYRCEKRKG